MTKTTQSIIRFGFGGLSLTAIIVQLYRHAGLGYDVTNFFSYFTNLSNLFSATILCTAAVLMILRRPASRLFELVRGCSVVCMLVVGVVFVTLLRGGELGSLLAWVNVVLHYIMPLVIFIDWLLYPPKINVTGAHVAGWLVFPLAYLVYSLVRGASIGWYPYPFLNPATAHGYAGVAAYCLAIFGLFLGFGWLVMKTAQRRSRPQLTER